MPVSNKTDSVSSPRARLVSCPNCGKQQAWRTDNPYRPFCSARCKSIDFGAWAAEEYRVPDTAEDQVGLSGPSSEFEDMQR